MSEPANAPRGSADPLSFDKVDLGQERKPTVCASCKKEISDTYFEVNGLVACPDCHDQLVALRSEPFDSQRFFRACVFGLGGAVVGGTLWWFSIDVIHLAIGIVAIFVGYLVGMGVRKGSGHRGGLAYQAVAMVLTYLAIVAGYAPQVVQALDEAHWPHDFAFAAKVAEVSIEAPFRILPEHIITFAIILFGIYEAWKLNKRVPLNVTGPLRVKAARAATPA